MRFALCLVAAALAGGCVSAGDETPKANQVKAIGIVWHGVYGQGNDPPVIEWHHGIELWPGTNGFTCAGWKVIVADNQQEIIDQQWPILALRFSDTSLAHELMHERTFERTGDIDAAHSRGDWNLVEQANSSLYFLGL